MDYNAETADIALNQNPKPEGRNPKEIRSPKPEIIELSSVHRLLQISAFGWRPSARSSDFGLRPSGFQPFALGLLTVLLYGCGPAVQAPPNEQAAPPLAVQIVQPKRGAITRFVTLPGEIKPYQQATLYAKVAGYLKTINVDKGDQAKAGTILAEIEVPELLADRARYRAEVEVADLDFKRLSESQKKAPDLVMSQTVDDARGKLAIAQASLERIETLLNYAKIVAPFSGIITRRMVDPGAFIPAATSGAPGQNAAIVTLTDFSRVRLQAAVPEIEASLVALEQPVTLTVEGLPGRSIDGKVTRFSYVLDDASRTMLVEIELPNPKLDLRPGMYATVKIGIERKPEALLVPINAVVTEKAGTSVFVLADNKAKKTRVQTGFNDGTQVEISSGLSADQNVIVVGKRALADGQAVSSSESK
jgi:RND family efflux transporter MFP subunit